MVSSRVFLQTSWLSPANQLVVDPQKSMLPAVHLVVSGLVGVVVVILQLSIHRIDEGHV